MGLALAARPLPLKMFFSWKAVRAHTQACTYHEWDLNCADKIQLPIWNEAPADCGTNVTKCEGSS